MLPHLRPGLVPLGLVLLTCEVLNTTDGRCTIVMALGGEPELLGRTEDCSNCIFSSFPQTLGRVVAIMDARTHPAYLELQPGVASEAFAILSICGPYRLIVNAEFGPGAMTKAAIGWVQSLVNAAGSQDSHPAVRLP